MFYLAARLGMTVSDLGERLTRRELNEWYSFTKIETEQKTMKPKPEHSEKKVIESLDSFARKHNAIRKKKHGKG